MKVIVLGSGITGTAAAWFLRQAGHDVTVIERRPGAAQETTFGNGSQISVSHSEPWANPSAPSKILKWLGKEDAPLLYRFRAEQLQWEWGARFLLECSPRRTAHNTRQCVAMSDFSKRTLRALREETKLDYTHSSHGIMHFYTDKEDYESSKAGAKLMTSLGCPRNTISPDEVVQIEPALSPVHDKLIGGDFTPDDEHGDSREFTVALSEKAIEKGVEFRFNTTATRLIKEGSGAASRIVAVETITPTGEFEVLKADAFVISKGSFSAPFLKPLGIDQPVNVSAKFYMPTKRRVDLTNLNEALHDILVHYGVLTDDNAKIIVSTDGSRVCWDKVEPRTEVLITVTEPTFE